jgi:hypothetical protein
LGGNRAVGEYAHPTRLSRGLRLRFL